MKYGRHILQNKENTLWSIIWWQFQRLIENKKNWQQTMKQQDIYHGLVWLISITPVCYHKSIASHVDCTNFLNYYAQFPLNGFTETRGLLSPLLFTLSTFFDYCQREVKMSQTMHVIESKISHILYTDKLENKIYKNETKIRHSLCFLAYF